MAKKMSERLKKVMAEHGLDSGAVWDCHGTWVMYHAACEVVAAKAGIKFDPPTVIVSGEKLAVICVTGHMGERSEWSFGEAAPANNKNAYPWAMAEKRAKDRVILKLVGLSGEVYSEEEADDFKPGRKDLGPGEKADEHLGRGQSAYQSKKDGLWERLTAELFMIDDVAALRAWWDEVREGEDYKTMPVTWRGHLKEEVEKHRDYIRERSAA